MTFFLQQDQATDRVANAPSVDIPSYFGGVGAAFSRAAIENNANFRLQREREKVKNDLAMSIVGRMTVEDVVGYATRNGADFNEVNKAPATMDEAIQAYPDLLPKWAIGAAREQKDLDPAGWGDVDLSDEGIETTINERLKREHEELSQVFNLLPSGQGSASLIGSMLGISLDIKNLPFMLMGGGGAVLRIAAREAAINVAAEAAFLPDQFKMSDRLDIPDPNIGEQLAMAAAFGAGFGGGLAALGRGLDWWRARSEVRAVSDLLSDLEQHQIDDAVQDAFERSARDPVMEAQTAVGDMLSTRAPADVASPSGRIDAASVGTLLQRAAPDDPPATVFVTARGSTYSVFDDGTTTRLKAERSDPGHEGDFGVKPRSVRTVYVEGDASALSAAGIQNLGPRGARVAIKDGKASLLWWNDAGNGWGAPASARNTPVFDEPKIGRYPLELWARVDDVPGYEAYSNMHAGNAITEVADAADIPVRGAVEAADGAPAQSAPKPSGQRQAPSQAATDGDKPAPTRTTDPTGQRDMFDDPTSPKARAVHDSVAADLRARIEADPALNFEIDIGDGGGMRRLSDILDDIENSTRLAETLQLCGTRT